MLYALAHFPASSVRNGGKNSLYKTAVVSGRNPA